MTPRFLIITMYATALRDRFANDSQTGRDILYFHDVVPEGLTRDLRSPHQVLFAETEEAANILAMEILRKNPGVVTHVGQINTLFNVKRKPVVDIGMAKYTEKGLVPQ